jgi:monoamine oxidase
LDTKVLIIGGGISGLHTAYTLAQQGIDCKLLEARPRLGGRIMSRNWQQADYTDSLPAYDMGPAWFWPGQSHMENLVQELGLSESVFMQQETGDAVYENAEGKIVRGIQGISMAGSYRMRGGNAQLISALEKGLSAGTVMLNALVTQLEYIDAQESGIRASVTVDGKPITLNCEAVVIAAPPRVAVEQIRFAPALPEPRVTVLNGVQTWMAGHAKLLAFYDTPFWLEQGFSGDCVSQVGPMHEIHDASPADDGPAALFGFMGVPAIHRGDQQALKQAAIAQLVRFFGEQAATPLDIYFKDWAKDRLTATALDQEMMTSHPSNDIQQIVEAGWSQRLIWSGTETAPNGSRFNGYLEGALEASVRAVSELLKAPDLKLK